MTVAPAGTAAASGLVQRARAGVYALAVVTAAALGSSAALLYRSGVGAGTSVVAALPPSLMLGALGVASRYLCRATPLRSSTLTRFIGTHAFSAAAAGGLWIATWNAWLDALSLQAIRTNVPLLLALGIVLYAVTVVVQYLLLELDAAREAEQAALRYQLLAREAELRAFKAQVDPHFLFNSLNAVASLCGSNPQQAREMAQRLADFFRLMLRVGKLDAIPLREELDLISRYLEIEKVRFGPRLQVRIAADQEVADIPLPPLLLQPLVENAVRHGIASVVDGGDVTVEARSEGGMLHIRIENPADPDRAASRGEGIGLQNARGRLRAVSNGTAFLRTEETDGRFRVDIEIPQ